MKQEEIDLTKQSVMPTHQDLINAKKLGLLIFTNSPYAVYVKKVSAKNRAGILDHKNTSTEKNLIEGFYKKFNYEFLVDFQFKTDTELSNSELKFMEEMQQVNSAKHICMNEKSYRQTPLEFENQLKGWISRNKNKEIIPVSEVHTIGTVEKINIAKKLGIKKFAIKFRSYKKYASELSKFLALINRFGMYSIVFGVTPTKDSQSKATMLLPPLKYETNFVSRWIAWGGREVPMSIVCEDWKYNLLDNATKGATNYNGQNRLQILSKKNPTSFNTAFEKIDTINQVTAMIPNISKLTEKRFKILFN